MEHYRRLGFANEIRALGMPGDHPTDIAYFTPFSGYELGRAEMPSANQAATRIRELAHIWNGAELPHRVPQSLVEQVLFNHANEFDSVDIAFNWRATGAVPEHRRDISGTGVASRAPNASAVEAVRQANAKAISRLLCDMRRTEASQQ